MYPKGDIKLAEAPSIKAKLIIMTSVPVRSAASIVMVAIGILSEQEARDAVNWEVYITVAAAFGIGTALVNSGVAGGIAGFMVKIGLALGIGSKYSSDALSMH